MTTQNLNPAYPLLKVGLCKPTRDWLTSRPGYTFYGPMNIFDCGGTQSLLLNRFGAEVIEWQGGTEESALLYEIPDRLLYIYDPDATKRKYLLLTKLLIQPGGNTPYQQDQAPSWIIDNALTKPYDDATGKWSGSSSVPASSDILAQTTYTIGSWPPNPPPPPVAPMPAPAMGSKIPIKTTDFTDIDGYAQFTANPNGTMDFQCVVNWWSPLNSTFLEVYFDVPNMARGKAFVCTGFSPLQPIGGNVTVKVGDDSIDFLKTTPWTQGNTYLSTYMIFEARNLQPIPVPPPPPFQE